MSIIPTVREILPGAGAAEPRVAPASFGQARLWLLDRLEPGSAVYNAARAVWLDGRLDVDSLRRSLGALADRHESLRTCFVEVDGVPHQRVHPKVEIALEVIEVDSPERDREALRMGREEARRPFDLARAPLLRAALLVTGERRHLLVLTLHHAVTDGWSHGVLWRELGALYAAFCSNAPPALPELKLTYTQFARDQRELQQGEWLAREAGYWKSRLAGLPALQLPTTYPRPPTRSNRGTELPIVIPREQVDALTRLSRSEGATLFMTLLAAFEILLGRYSGQNDFGVAAPIAVRRNPEAEKLIGLFINTLVLRASLDEEQSFRSVLAQVRGAAIEAYSHQELSFEKLVEALDPERDASRSPLAQVMFAFQNFPRNPPRFPGLECEEASIDTGTAKFELNLYLAKEADELRGSIEYSTDLFNRETIERMIVHFRTLLAAIVAEPDRPISGLALLPEAERRRLLVEWNQTRAEYPRTRTVCELFERQVTRTPDAPAVACGEETWSYDALNRRSNQLAHALRKRGFGSGARVGVCLERSLELVVAMLGVLKAGATYVPLDPGHPSPMLAHIIGDSGIGVVLSHGESIHALPGEPIPRILLDCEWPEIGVEPHDNVPARSPAEQVAYIMYTSGSTGTSKGVMVAHRSLCNYMTWILREFPLAADDRVLQKTPIGWDPSLREVFAPLLAGALLVLAPPLVHLDSRALARLVRDRGITWLQLVPKMLESLLVEPEMQQCISLRRLFVCGEVLSAALLARATRLLGATVCNLYGPTETCMTATFWTCHGEYESSTAPPIGRPIFNTRLYALDRHMQVVPVGVPGELYIGGEGVALGYLDRPALNTERFLPDPFSEEGGGRMYRTGDAVRYRPNGDLEYLGRLDQQVKIRGFRVDLAEIEAALALRPEVTHCAVMPKLRGAEGERLVAYLVVAREGTVDRTLLREFLRSRLPDYMVPAAYVVVAALPLLANGKLDHRRLPDPGPDDYVAPSAVEGPRDAVEERIAEVWCELLATAHIGVHQDFFEVGGHSLLAARVVARIQSLLEVEIGLREFFHSPTIAGLAAEVARLQSLGTPRSAPPIRRRDRTAAG